MTQTPPERYLRGQVATHGTSFHSRHLRGQVATEFMLYTAVFILIAVGAFVVVSDLQNTEVPLQQNTVAKEVGDGFVTAITLSVKAGQGFSYNYTFPKTLFARPYVIDMSNINEANSSITIEYFGEYSDFSYRYALPKYNYHVIGGCITDMKLASSNCSNTLMLNNDGENLTIVQLP